ncbi:MAG TPA: YceH family protein [Candidatus Acidoferrales bacterium]
MSYVLDFVETRVLGVLVEKEITTPDYYPLSLNALVNACNQKSNRDPVMELDEAAVRTALRTLDDKALARSAVAGDSRVAKYEHQLQEAFNFTRPETAILCELMLRGPQTPGELRGRASRFYAFEDLSTVHSGLQKLIQREPPLVKLLQRQPGTKEARYAQLLSGDVAESTPEPSPETTMAAPEAGTAHRTSRVEEDIADLKAEIADLKRQFAEFRKQFE